MLFLCLLGRLGLIRFLCLLDQLGLIRFLCLLDQFNHIRFLCLLSRVCEEVRQRQVVQVLNTTQHQVVLMAQVEAGPFVVLSLMEACKGRLRVTVT
jgi:hypothetical protein